MKSHDIEITLQAKDDEISKLRTALKDLLEVVQWLQDSGNIKSPIEPHPFGLAVIQAKQQARAALED